MARINFLPPWVETNLQPAFYDLESGTCLQQTARMYDKVNQLVRSVNEQNDTIADYIQQFIDLKDYCEDYFDNLDVQEEINHKLDEMVKDGTLTALISGYVDPYINEQNAHIDAQDNAIDAQDAKISAIQATIAGLSNGSPEFVSSTDDMTDPDKVYVLTTDGSIYTYNGEEFTDTGLDYGIDSKVFTGVTTVVASTADLDDCNNALANRAYLFTASNIPNMPVAKAGVLITFRYNQIASSNRNGMVQFYFGSDGKSTYKRIHYSGVWRSWVNIQLDFETLKDYEWLFEAGGLVSSTDDLDDFNNAKYNRCYLIFTDTIPNQPVASQGMLITFKHNTSTTNKNGIVQTYVTSTQKVYTRTYYGNHWNDWKQVVTSDMLPYSSTSDSSSISIFENIGVIGDSFASGTIDSAPEGHRNRYSISWLQVMARNCGFNAINFAVGGLSTRTWLTSASGLTLLNSSPAQDLYLIALGINDIRDITDNLETLGSIADIDLDNPASNPNTFYGNYGKILSAIKTKSADAKVVLITIPKVNTGNNKMINDAIIEIATTFDLPIIISHDNPLFTSAYFSNEKGDNGHPTVAGYGSMALAYQTMLNECIATYYDYFKDYLGSETVS